MQFIKVHKLNLESYLINIDEIESISTTKGGNTCLFVKGNFRCRFAPCYVCVESIDEIFAMINKGVTNETTL